MKSFMDKDFLLETETAKKLFHDYADKMPIVDYHCHINAKEIAQDRQFDNMTQLWLGADHYKWRLMRSAGVEEHYITGDASDQEKFFKWAEVLGNAIGIPLFHWSHLELQRYFDYHGVLNEQTAKEVWNLCNEKLKDPMMSAKNLILRSHVTTICTTDDPIDSLKWHKEISNDPSFEASVFPTFRPDRAMNLEKPDYTDYLEQLSGVSYISIHSFQTLIESLQSRMDHFSDAGCKISDHGSDYVMYEPADADEIESIFSKRLCQETLTPLEIRKFKTAFMLALGKEYHKRNWVMQLHYGCKRDNNQTAFKTLGADTGFDCIGNPAPVAQLIDFMNALNLTNELPKTILYSLNPNDNETLGTVLGCFQNSDTIGKIQHGSAWWFNDHKTGIQNQITSLANLGYLAGFVGMLTDSRSFLSYTRHEYFRRILCNYIGNLVENGEYPADSQVLGKLVEQISYHNAMKYFGF